MKVPNNIRVKQELEALQFSENKANRFQELKGLDSLKQQIESTELFNTSYQTNYDLIDLMIEALKEINIQILSSTTKEKIKIFWKKLIRAFLEIKEKATDTNGFVLKASAKI